MFDEELRRVEETRPPCILLDLRELAAQRRARRAGRRLLLVRGGRAIQRLLALTAVDAAFEIVGDIPIELRTQPAGENGRRSGSAPTSACSASTHGLSAVRLSSSANGATDDNPGVTIARTRGWQRRPRSRPVPCRANVAGANAAPSDRSA